MDTKKARPAMTADRGRNDGLDLLRATGAFLVFATHLYWAFGMDWLGPIAKGGALGIYIFFPLSGYLLYRPFVTGTVDLRRYGVARAARLFPAYYLALGGTLLLGLTPNIAANPVPALTFTANTIALGDLSESGFGQTWTLGVELLFYALLPFVAAAIGRWPWLMLAIIPGWWLGVHDSPDYWALRQLPIVAWAFGFGMLAARYQDRLGIAAKAWPLGVVLLVAGLLNSGPSLAEGSDLVALGTCVLILWAVHVRPRMPWARWPASLSYSVYLWHLWVTITLAGAGVSGVALLVTTVPATIGIAWLSFVLVERPVLRWSGRLRQRDIRDSSEVVAGGRNGASGAAPGRVEVRADA